MASGRPVIAYGRGGALETVVEGRTGLFFQEQTEEAVLEVVSRFEGMENHFSPEDIRSHAVKYGRERFRNEMAAIVSSCLESRSSGVQEVAR
jgi:glycosyltransferase involved in cell wall biosynthesis